MEIAVAGGDADGVACGVELATEATGTELEAGVEVTVGLEAAGPAALVDA